MKRIRDVREAPDRIVMAIDGGGTRSRCAVADADGRILGTGVSGPANAVQCAWSVVRRNLTAAVRSARVEAGVEASRIRAVAAGLAGIPPGGEGGEPVERLLRRSFRRARISVTGDAVIALRGAIPDGPGVVALSGTGSTVVGVSADGTWIRVGGGGALVGGDGSGYRIALAGLRAAWRAHDGRARPTRLVHRLARALGVRRFGEVVGRLYSRGLGRDRVAELAREVLQAGERGDPAALEILREAGRELGHSAATAVRRLGTKGIVRVSWQGPVFEAGGAFRDAFVDSVRAEWPDAEVRAPAFPPLAGAFLTAAGLLGVRAGGAVLERFAQQFRNRAAGGPASRRAAAKRRCNAEPPMLT
jgi:N-acetylglucosamine kinase-like BadF-type ATPase